MFTKIIQFIHYILNCTLFYKVRVWTSSKLYAFFNFQFRQRKLCIDAKARWLVLLNLSFVFTNFFIRVSYKFSCNSCVHIITNECVMKNMLISDLNAGLFSVSQAHCPLSNCRAVIAFCCAKYFCRLFWLHFIDTAFLSSVLIALYR